MNTRIHISGIKTAIAASLLVVSFIGCSEDEVMPRPSVQKADLTEAIPYEAPDAVSSISISGVHTLVVTDLDCSTCTYIVPEDTRTVDGAALHLEPGSVICLQTGATYKAVEFENIIGSPEKPIVIGYCRE